MATNLGDAVLTAIWEQGWALDRLDGGNLHILAPTGQYVVDGYGIARERLALVAEADRRVFDDVMESWQLFLLIDHLVAWGFRWPWPPIPDPRGPVKGTG